MGTRISFSRPDGKEASGYLAKAGGASRPGVIVIQEWWGLQDQITGICDRLALAGYEALAPDLYSGKVIPYHDDAAANAELTSLDFLDATDQTVRAAALYLGKTGAKVGIVGFCMGGAVAMLAAMRIPEISAAITFYGLPPEQAIKPADFKVPVQGHFAGRDDWVSPARAKSFEDGLRAAHKKVEVFSYDAEHAFMNEQRNVHERAAAELGWKRMLDFWKAHIG